MEFSIQSNRSDRELVFSNLKDDYFEVEIRGFKVSASTSVYAYTDANNLNNIFQELGKLDKPWNDVKKWEAIEGEFCLEISCDKLGHVSFTIKLRMEEGYPEEAQVVANLTTDFGALPSIARDAKDFFEQN